MAELETYAGATLLGALSGMRSMSAPAVLGRLSKKGALSEVTGPLALVSRSGFAMSTGLLALGETVADKLPFAPNRTAAGPLLGRALMGALSGAVICSSRKKSVWIGALLGGAAAVGMAYGAFELRRKSGEILNVPDGVIALAEDAVVGSVGLALASRFS